MRTNVPREAARARGRSAVQATVVAKETEQIAVRVPAAFARRMRSAVRFTPDLTITELVVRAVSGEIDRLERKRGELFPRDGGPVRRDWPMRRD
jgi:hypothetical protein